MAAYGYPCGSKEWGRLQKCLCGLTLKLHVKKSARKTPQVGAKGKVS